MEGDPLVLLVLQWISYRGEQTLASVSLKPKPLPSRQSRVVGGGVGEPVMCKTAVPEEKQRRRANAGHLQTHDGLQTPV